MQPIDVIASLAAAASRADKEKIVFDAYSRNCVDFFEAMKLAADPFMLFDVKRVGEITQDDGAAGSLGFAEFRALCQSLHDQSLTGEAARGAIHQAAERCDARTWNGLYRPVLLKGLGEVAELVDAVLKRLGDGAQHLRAPVFAGQTATARGGKPHGRRLVDAKVPGERLFAVLGKGLRLHAATGSAHEGGVAFDGALRQLAARLPGQVVLDGVLTAAGDYMIFDLVPLDGFRNRLCRKTQVERRAALAALQQSGGFAGSRRLRVLPQVDIDFDSPDGAAVFAETAARARADGHSAMLAKKPEAGYAGGKNANWQLHKIE